MSDERPGGLPLHSTGLNLAELDLAGGEGFWDEVARFADQSRLDEELDELMGGRASPRVWVFCDDADQGPTAAAVALAAARILADRGLSVVLLDADETRRDLTRWLGRTEQEGWIDILRYGASLHMASDALPSEGRRGSAVGVGSFTPTGVTPAEVADIVGRLRRQSDDLVIIAPASANARPWYAAADVRVLAWDRLSREEDRTAELIQDLASAGIVMDAVVGFGVEEHAAIASRLREQPTDEEPASPEVLPDEEAEAPASPEVLPDEEAEAPEVSETIPEPDPTVLTSGERRRSSGIFWFVAAAAVVAIALLGWFYLSTRPSTKPPERPTVAAVTPVETKTEPDVPAETEAAQDMPAEMEPEPTPEVPAEVIPAPVEPAEVEPEPEVPAVPTFDLGPYEIPVGQDGWALWFSSVPDSLEAQSEVARLDELGIRAAFRAEEIEGKGTWYRVYVGSFASKDAAREAAPLLKEKLDHDWAMPRRF